MFIIVDLQLLTMDWGDGVCGYDTNRCTLKEHAGLNGPYLLDCAVVTDGGGTPSLGNN